MHYVESLLKRIFSIIHICYVKVIHPKRFFFRGISVISNTSHFTINDSGKIELGENVGIRRYCEFSVAEKGKIELHKNTFFNNGCMLVSHNMISVGEGTRFGPNVLVYDKNREAFLNGKHISESIFIGKNCWIGAGTILLKGTVIGNNCVVGAGCVIKGHYGDNVTIVQKRTQSIKELN